MPFLDEKTLKVNALGGVILVVAEKMLENDFVCSCNYPYRNVVFLHFFIPVLFYMVMVIKWFKPGHRQQIFLVKTFLISSFLWIVLLLTDGRYVACLEFSSNPPCNNTINVTELQSTPAFFKSKVSKNTTTCGNTAKQFEIILNVQYY